MADRDAEDSKQAEDGGLELLFSTALPQGTSAEAYARRLRLLEEGRGPVLTDDEFAELRESMLDEIRVRGRLWSPIARLLSLLLLVTGAVTVLGLYLGVEAVYFGAGFLVFVLLLTLGSIIFKTHRANRLSLSDRLSIVAHLEAQELLPPDEAQAIRRSILGQYGDRMPAQRMKANELRLSTARSRGRKPS